MNINVKNVIARLRDWCFTIGTKSFARTVSVKMSRNLCRPFPLRSPMPSAGNCPRVKGENTVWSVSTPVPGDRLLFSPGGGPSPIQQTIDGLRPDFVLPFLRTCLKNRKMVRGQGRREDLKNPDHRSEFFL